MSDQTTAELLTGICEPCAADDHDNCRADSLNDPACLCRCVGSVQCPTCGKTVVLYADDEPGLAQGECCHWLWVDGFEGCQRFDLRPRSADDGRKARVHNDHGAPS